MNLKEEHVDVVVRTLLGQMACIFAEDDEICTMGRALEKVSGESLGEDWREKKHGIIAKLLAQSIQSIIMVGGCDRAVEFIEKEMSGLPFAKIVLASLKAVQKENRLHPGVVPDVQVVSGKNAPLSEESLIRGWSGKGGLDEPGRN